MDVAEPAHLLPILQGGREAIARRWYQAIARTGFVPLSSREVRERLGELTDEAIAALLAEPFARPRAEAIGAALARLHYVHPAALAGTLEVLAEQLLAGLPAQRAAALQPRLAALLGAIAAGFSAQARDTILSEQEAVRGALLAERQRVEEALRQSEARFRAIVEGAAVAIGVAGMDARLVETNGALQRMLGYSGEALLGRSFAEFMHPEDAMAGWQQFQELMTGRREHYEADLRFFRQDGRLVWGHLTTSLVRDAEGRPQYVIGMGEDITERVQAHETIRQLNVDLERRVTERTAQLTAANQELAGEVARRMQAEAERIQLLAREQAARAEAEAGRQRLAFLAEASSLLVSSLDYRATLADALRLVVPYLADWCAVDVVAEDGALRRLAVAHVNLAKTELVRELQEHRPPAPDALSGVAWVLRTGGAEFLPEIPQALLAAVAPDARHRWLRDELRPVSRITVPLIARERTLGALSLVLAESGRRYTEQDLALAGDLAERAAVAIDNARLYQEAQEALATRDVFLSVAAHELKTPLTNVLGYTELAGLQLSKEGGPDLARVRRAVEALDREAHKLSRLVSQLLDISRVEAGQLALSRTATNISRLVEDVAASMQLGAGQHVIDVRAPSRVRALVDPLRLEQVLTNLLSNALKYSPRGTPIEVEVAQPDPETVRITVRDRGRGIAPEHRGQLFERYYRTQRNDAVAGLGLGLYISRQIVELHGGRIEAAFPPEGGTAFVVSLPTGLSGQEAAGEGGAA